MSTATLIKPHKTVIKVWKSFSFSPKTKVTDRYVTLD